MKIAQILFFFFLAITASRAATVLTFGGQGYVSQNQVTVMGPANGYSIKFFGTQDNNNPRAMIDVFTQSESNLSNFTNIQLLSVEGADFTAGRYLDATWFEIGHPGLIFSTSSRGFNDFNGWFDILEIEWGTDNKPSVLAIDFYIKENTPNINWVQGSLRYNSNIPVGPVPEPSSTLLILGTLACLTRRRR